MTDLYAAAVDAADVEPDLEATTDFPDAPLPLIEVCRRGRRAEAAARARDRRRDRGDRRGALRRGHVWPAPVRQEFASQLAAGPGGEPRLHRRPRHVAADEGPGHLGPARRHRDGKRRAGGPAAHRRRGDGWLGRGRKLRPDIVRPRRATSVVARLQLAGRAGRKCHCESLGLVSRLARKIEADEAGGNSDHLPDLWWVLRDFALELVNADGDEIDSDEYLERSLRRTNRRESDEYRAAIALAFERRRCATLPRPYEAESDLRADTNKPPRPAFAAALADFRRRLFTRPRPKRVRGAALRGKTFVALAATYVDAFNAGATPVVSSAWTAVVKAECDQHDKHKICGRGDAGVAAHAAAPLAVSDDAPEAAFAAARLEGCRACDGIVAAASNDAVLRSSVGDRPLLDARRRCDHDFAEKLRRRRDRCRTALTRATTAVEKKLAPRLRATRGETHNLYAIR